MDFTLRDPVQDKHGTEPEVPIGRSALPDAYRSALVAYISLLIEWQENTGTVLT